MLARLAGAHAAAHQCCKLSGTGKRLNGASAHDLGGDPGSKAFLIALCILYAAFGWFARRGRIQRGWRSLLWWLIVAEGVFVWATFLALQNYGTAVASASPAIGTFLFVAATALGFVGALLLVGS